MTTEIPARPDGVLYGRGAANIAALDHEHAVARVAVEALRLITSMGSNTEAWPPEVEMRKAGREALAKIKASGWQP